MAPLLFAVIMFLMIRLTNDIPMNANYFMHSWRFIVIELIGVIAGNFLCYHLAWQWIKFSIEKHIGVLFEYFVVMIVPAVLVIVVMAISHEVLLLSELPDIVIPMVITVLMSIWMYLTMKSQYLSRLYSESRLREQEAKQATTEADLKLLRAQFHPHFLFNMLNTIYFTIDEDNEKARDTIENLSNLLRLQLYEVDGNVSLEREISALNSYLELCRVRFGESMMIESKIDIKINSYEIQPHLLLPLVENAIKHSGGNLRCVKVSLIGKDNIIELTVENTVSASKASLKEESGLGLNNLRKRLMLLYPNKFELKTERIGNEYIAYLKLELS